MLRTPVERHQQVQTGGADEGQPAQIEHQARGTVHAAQRGAQRFGDGGVNRGGQRLDGGEVELAAGLHDRHMIAPLHLDGERLVLGGLGGSSCQGGTRAVG